ncbi:phosphatase domain containing paladin 1b isoform X2 [Triplophysa dalaica]|uniref:phosphatase domain containing paladin 1b isoform X2 n=1 Tax=Triplophysa dalaica TaxID=1582913 RepID=UPI0024DF7C27|nr:phosphatase domain containing paladin 1b isoform X2 [Triplophysa dalaica]
MQKPKDVSTRGTEVRPSVQITGVSASATSQAAPLTQQADHQGNSMAEERHSLQSLSIRISKAKSIITNKVAPVVITYNCREEFQIHDKIQSANYSLGRISEMLPEHYLVLGEFFMVQDVYNGADVLNTTKSCGAPNFRKVKGNYPLFGMGQPSLRGFKQVLQRLQNDKYEEVIFICVREEPVVFFHIDEDFIPYTPRRRENLHENLHDLDKGLSAVQMELSIQKELCDLAKLTENMLYVYNDIEHFKDEPQRIKILSEEDIYTTEEVYKRPLFSQPLHRYYRLPLPMEGAPMEERFDEFVKILRENPNLSMMRDTSRPLPALLFSCQVGVGRTNFGLILGALVLHHLQGASQNPSEEVQNSEHKLDFKVIQLLVSRLPKGQQVLKEVDDAIAMCSEMHDIKDAVYENKLKLEGMGEDYQIQESSATGYFLQQTLQSLERYLYLIVFNAYLHDQFPQAFPRSFSEWMCMNAWIYRQLANVNSLEFSAPASLITDGIRVLVSSEFLVTDLLSTAKEMKVANFRRVSKMALYGAGQPCSETLSVVLSYLTDHRRGHSGILWINLQEELALEGNGQMFTPREPGYLEEPISVWVQHPRQLQELELAMKENILRSEKWLEVITEQEKQMRILSSCHTVEELFIHQKSIYPCLTYQRIPLSECCAPKEEVFDRLLEAMKCSLAHEPCCAFVFNCLDGKDRTTAAMVIATLTLWHVNGFPECEDEEIVSVPDAKYTKGEFEVVMQVVRLLPNGHRVKREVDTALDLVSETMTPMHYHLREIIISTYRQIRTAKSEADAHWLRLRSLQYLERYIYLILFNCYLHLEKKDSWRRSFSHWMHQVAAKAGIYTILNHLGFSEFENLEDSLMARLRFRWLPHTVQSIPMRGDLI